LTPEAFCYDSRPCAGAPKPERARKFRRDGNNESRL
jgi:hypothetical protein